MYEGILKDWAGEQRQQRKAKLLSCDNGLSGALCLLNLNDDTVEIKDTQVADDGDIDCSWLFNTISDWQPDFAIIEVCFNNNGLVKRGGFFIGFCRLLQIPVTEVAVGKWKKVMLGQKTDNKQLSVETCLRLMPTANIERPTPKGKKVNLDHNRAEAALLSLYLKQTLSP